MSFIVLEFLSRHYVRHSRNIFMGKPIGVLHEGGRNERERFELKILFFL